MSNNEQCLCKWYPNYKKFIKYSFLLLLPLIFDRWFYPYKTYAGVSQNIWTPISIVPLSHLGNILMELFAMFMGDSSHVFIKNIQMRLQKMKFQ
jgi:hypothetical protein